MPGNQTTTMKKDDSERWFAMRVTYRREMRAKQELEDSGFRVFIPMVMAMVRDARTRKEKRMEVPAIHNLLFAYAKPSLIQKFKDKAKYLQYHCMKSHSTGRSEKIIIPDEEMEAFIRLYTDGQAEVLEEKELLPGTPVRIISGPFEGMTGTFQRVNGHRNRYFVITLNGLISIGSALIRPEMVVSLNVESCFVER